LKAADRRTEGRKAGGLMIGKTLRSDRREWITAVVYWKVESVRSKISQKRRRLLAEFSNRDDTQRWIL
jgi:hypothetical protein